ncbi:MAG: hypothetical protein K9M45_01620 [Kiritimatiellales bacterium]|nr:hypothetical protein [Kiritimatiellales bacterium]
MIDKNEYPICNTQTQRTIVLAAGETDRRIRFFGSFISCLTNSSASYDVLVSINGGNTTALRAGTGFPVMRLSNDRSTLIPSTFQYVELSNPSGEEMTVEIILALGTPTDTRSVVQGYIQVDLSAPEISTAAAVTVQTAAHTVLQSDARIKERVLQNNGDYPVWWGDEDTNPATMKGIKINPGGMAVVNCWGSVYLKAEDGATVVSVNNILKVT